MSVFDLSTPEGPSRPLLVEVPHAGLELPEELRGEIVASAEAIRRDADIYVDKLYARAPLLGASLLVARMSRYVVDLNRAQNDVDAATVTDHPTPGTLQPRGVVWRHSSAPVAASTATRSFHCVGTNSRPSATAGAAVIE